MPTFARPDIAAERRADGSWVLCSRTPLEPYERSVGAVLARQARSRPQADLLCERDAEGAWRRLTYGEAWRAARAIGQALLDRGLGPERPAMVLSGNSIDHGLLMLGCFVAGVPLVPVSAAYSLQSGDFTTLAHVVRRTGPGLVYVGAVEPHARALAAVELRRRHPRVLGPGGRRGGLRGPGGHAAPGTGSTPRRRRSARTPWPRSCSRRGPPAGPRAWSRPIACCAATSR